MGIIESMTLREYLDVHHKQHLIFDFDETLFTLRLPWEVYINTLTQKLLDLDASLQKFTHAKTLNDLENEAVRRHGEQARKLRIEYSGEFEREFLKEVDEHSVYTSFVAENYQKYNCYVWTSNVRATIEPILREHDLLKCFKKLVTKSDLSFTKPDPEGFYQIFNPMFEKKEDFLMIGDSQNDMHAAANAGIDFYSVKKTLTKT